MLNMIMGAPLHNQPQYSSYVSDAIGVPHIYIFGHKQDSSRKKLTMITIRFVPGVSLSSLPILSDESFTFDYSIKRGIVLQFKKRD